MMNIASKLAACLLNQTSSSSSLIAQSVRGLKMKGEYMRGIGYKYTNHFKGGLLPRLDPKLQVEDMPLPEYKPKDSWSQKRATFGQNDYIDILGDGDVKPVDLIRGPRWLIGFRGNELQRMVRQMKFEGKRLRAVNPSKFFDLRKRIKYVYWRYNVKFGGRKK